MNTVFRFVVAAAVVAGCLAQCPPPDTLGPCECHEDANGGPALRCSRLSGWSEVQEVIENGLPHLASFEVVNSPELSDLPPAAFGAATIDEVWFYNTGLVYLGRDVFSAETAAALTTLYVKHNYAFTSLDNDVAGHLVGLDALYVSYNKLGSLEGALEPTAVTTIDFSHNGITQISANYFAQCSALTVLLLAFNELTTAALGDNTLSVNGDPEDLYVDLTGNYLEGGVSLAAFGGQPPKELVLSFNNITTLDSSVFEPLLSAMQERYGSQAYILLDHNELGCGCGMAWVVDHASKALLQQATCADGRFVANLTPADFTGC